jgi:hypothetical protein
VSTQSVGTNTIPSTSATDLGPPLEATSPPESLLPSAPTSYPSIPFTAPPSVPLSTTTTLTPGPNGAAPTVTTTSTGSYTDPGSGITTTVSGNGGRANLVPNRVELAVPVVQQGGAQLNVLGGAQTSGFTTGVGLSLTDGDINLGLTYRRITPADLQSGGSNQYGANLSVGSKPRFTGSVSVLDQPGVAGDTITISGTLTAPLGNGWTGAASGTALLRPGDNNDTIAGGLQFSNDTYSVGVGVSQNGSETVGTVRFGVNF